MSGTAVIPDRALFRTSEVCEVAGLQPFVLRTWEAEFPDLGVAKSRGGARVYRRADVERVLEIKKLLFVEGLTLAGARRRLESAGRSDEPPALTVDDVLGPGARARLVRVKAGLASILDLLGGGLNGPPRADAAGESSAPDVVGVVGSPASDVPLGLGTHSTDAASESAAAASPRRRPRPTGPGTHRAVPARRATQARSRARK